VDVQAHGSLDSGECLDFSVRQAELRYMYVSSDWLFPLGPRSINRTHNGILGKVPRPLAHVVNNGRQASRQAAGRTIVTFRRPTALFAHESVSGLCLSQLILFVVCKTIIDSLSTQGQLQSFTNQHRGFLPGTSLYGDPHQLHSTRHRPHSLGGYQSIRYASNIAHTRTCSTLIRRTFQELRTSIYR